MIRVHSRPFAALFAFAVLQLQAQPPAPPVKTVTDDYFGHRITDPYRYMENLNDPEVQAWIKAQDHYTRALLTAIPGRAKLLDRIHELSESAPLFNVSPAPNNFYLIGKTPPGEDVDKLYIRQGLSGEDRLLADPETIPVAPANRLLGKRTIVGSAISRDLRHIAVCVEAGGAENDTEIHVIDVTSARETGDVIPRAMGCDVDWLPGNRSFVYTQLQKPTPGAPETELRQKARCYLHVLGSDSEKDSAVFGYGVVRSIKVDPGRHPLVTAPINSHYALATDGDTYYLEPAIDLEQAKTSWRKVAGPSDEVKHLLLHGDDIYLLTNKGTNLRKVIRRDARKPKPSADETVVPPDHGLITGILAAQDALYVHRLDKGLARVLRVPYGGHPHAGELTLPDEGFATIAGSEYAPGIFVILKRWTRSAEVFNYNPRNGQLTDITGLWPSVPYDNPGNLQSVEVKVRSYDGTEVPLSIVHAKDLKLDGANPTLLEGYGAFGISHYPDFRREMVAWYERGGVYAHCHVRGGGELGEDWHQAGRQSTKPNTWRDFIACAGYLIEKKYTSPARLAGEGSSGGGILIGRAITERPDLFAAAIDEVGQSDMLRDATTANGSMNTWEFGSIATEEGFKALYAMSPYHHVQDQTKYPAVLLTTRVNDARVAPWNAAKMTARLQAATVGGKPILLRVDSGGHQGGSGRNEEEEQEADAWAFLLWQFGIPEFQPRR
jgi:prolyl oligopeptidase